MNFLQTIFERLRQSPSKPILEEVREGGLVPITCAALLEDIGQARRALSHAGLRGGDRCVLLAPNSSRWVALDLAIMAEGAIVVPLYSRQTPEELISMMKDCSPSLICCADTQLWDAVSSCWADSPPVLLFDQIFNDASPNHPRQQAVPSAAMPLNQAFAGPAGAFTQKSQDAPIPLQEDTPVAIIYTSGTSGEAKGVVLNVSNLNFMLQRTTARLQELMMPVKKVGDDRIFHYLPFCFAGSWILLLTCLSRNNGLMMSMDLNRLVDEIKVASPHYFLNVPALLERIQSGVHTQLRKKGGLGLALFNRGQSAWLRRHKGHRRFLDGLWLRLSARLVFPKIKQQLGPNLRALICGSAPLAQETQLFFQMIGVPVLQVYGLTETTAICTMDEVDNVIPGRVGPAIHGIEMRLGESDEILVRGPNIFPGYWKRAEATAEVIKNGWLYTGDQGHVDEDGNWKIIGRLKNLIISSSGHNISPEPIEQILLSALPEAEQIMVVGNGRKFLSVIITGKVTPEQVAAALEPVNRRLPHYKQVRKFYLSAEPFSVDNGLLTANRKLKRAAIEAHFKEQIENLYQETEPRQ